MLIVLLLSEKTIPKLNDQQLPKGLSKLNRSDSNRSFRSPNKDTHRHESYLEKHI